MRVRTLVRSALVVLFAVAIPALHAQTPLGSGMTYQGQLKASGGPANGSFNMVFTLWDASTVGTQVGPTLTFDGAGGNPPPVTVANGLFTVVLDFGATAYNGNARWLEITVNGTPLSPRQALTASPHARFSAAPWATNGNNISNVNSGNVGIGTTSPNLPLDLVSNDPNGTGFGLKNPANDGTAWSLRADGNGVPANRYSFRIRDDYQGIDRVAVDGWAGNVGIGTTAPASLLHLSSNDPSGTMFRIDNPAYGGNSWSLRVDGPNNGGASAYSFHIRSEYWNAARLSIDDAGNVGIGTITPEFLLHVNGSAGKPGGGSWSVASDARLKKNIEPMSGTLDRVLSLHGVTFEYNDPASVNELPGTRIGMVAQEIEKAFPDWVETAADGYKRVTYRGFEALTVEALRDLRQEKDAEIEALRAEKDAQIRELAERLSKIEALVEKLSAR